VIVSAFRLGGIGMEAEIGQSTFTNLSLKKSSKKKKRDPVWEVGIIYRITGGVKV